jgi:lipopolysaccharide export LptBFGC system permease protein LptF
MKRSAMVLALMLTCVATAHGGPIADRMMQSWQLREDAQDTLDLQYQQDAYRRDAGDLSPSKRMGLEQRQRQQQVEQRALQQRQRQQADTALRTQRAVPDHRSTGKGAIQAQQDRAEQQAQQLHFQIQQSTWPYRYTPPPSEGGPTPGPLDNRGYFR